MHKGRSNYYELKHNGKKIVFSSMSSTEVRSMNNKKPRLTMLASKKEVEYVLNQGEEILLLLSKKTQKWRLRMKTQRRR